MSGLAKFKRTHLIAAPPNSDPNGHQLVETFNLFVRYHSNAVMITCLGETKYLFCVAYLDFVVDNSSSDSIGRADKNSNTQHSNCRAWRFYYTSLVNCELNRISIAASSKHIHANH